jgi:hypothetical protein
MATSTTFEIAEVAQRSGFTAATLRYYEELGISPRVATGSPRGGAIDLQEGSGFQNVATSRNGGSRLHATLGSSARQPSTS